MQARSVGQVDFIAWTAWRLLLFVYFLAIWLGLARGMHFYGVRIEKAK
jgi:hypothetical protein